MFPLTTISLFQYRLQKPKQIILKLIDRFSLIHFLPARKGSCVEDINIKFVSTPPTDLSKLSINTLIHIATLHSHKFTGKVFCRKIANTRKWSEHKKENWSIKTSTEGIFCSFVFICI